MTEPTASTRDAARDDEPDDLPGGLIVEHYRLDASVSLRRSLGGGAAIVTLGAIVMAAAIIVPHFEEGRPLHVHASRRAVVVGGEVTADGTPVPHSPGLELVLGLLGLTLIAGGGATAIVGLRRVLSEESYLALRTDGALFRRGAVRELARWEDVEAVRAGPEGVCFELHDGRRWSRPERFAGASHEEIARRASEIRRKALFGLLPRHDNRRH